MGKPIVLWKGYHGAEIAELAGAAWRGELRLVCLPPGLNDLSFVPLLPEGPVLFRGAWDKTPSLPAPAGSAGTVYPDEPMIGLFSSGTVERKLVLSSKKNIEVSLDGIRSLFDTSRIGAVFCYPQPFHTFGLVLGYLHAERHGCELLCAQTRYGSAQHERRQGIRRPDLLTLGTPVHFHDWRAYAQSHGAPAPSYAAVIGGAPTTPDLWRAVRDEMRVEAPSIGYGATEASPGVTHLPPGQQPNERGEIGHPLPGVAAELVPGSGVAFTGPSVCLAIVRGSAIEFPERIVLADDVEARADGVWVYRGHLGRILNRGGEKFPLATLEETLRTRLDVEAVCVAVPDERLGEELGLVVRGGPGQEAIYAVLSEVYRREFDRRWYREVEDLPRTENAKVDRSAVSQLLLERSFPVSTEVLRTALPHRPPMVWIDEVLEASAVRGVARVRLRPDAPYCTGGRIRSSAAMEWMAQAYGYICAAHAWKTRADKAPPKRAFLAGVSGYRSEVDLEEASGEVLITVEEMRPFGPLTLFRGVVHDAKGRKLAEGRLKVFSES